MVSGGTGLVATSVSPLIAHHNLGLGVCTTPLEKSTPLAAVFRLYTLSPHVTYNSSISFPPKHALASHCLCGFEMIAFTLPA